jgi:hypothetical protein
MKGIVRFLVRMLVLNIVLLPLMALAPVMFVTLPFIAVHNHPYDNFAALGEMLFVLGPLSCAFYMLFVVHYPAVHRARLEGRLKTWRESEGGMLRTVTKSCIYMFGALFGSFLAEFAYLMAWHLPNGKPVLLDIWFAVDALVAYSPICLVLVVRALRNPENGRPARSLCEAASNEDFVRRPVH